MIFYVLMYGVIGLITSFSILLYANVYPNSIDNDVKEVIAVVGFPFWPIVLPGIIAVIVAKGLNFLAIRAAQRIRSR